MLAAKTPTISFSLGEHELLSLGAAQMQGDYAAGSYFQSLDAQENQSFVKRFKTKFGPQRVTTDPMEAAYAGVKLWASAVQDAESVVTGEIRKAMRNQRVVAPGGEVRIDSETQHVFKWLRIGRIRDDGQFDIVFLSDSAIQPLPYPASRTVEDWKSLLQGLYSQWNNQWAKPEGSIARHRHHSAD